MLGELRNFGKQLGQRLWAYSPTLALLLGFAGLAGVAWAAGVVINRLSTYYFAKSYTERLVQSRGLDPHLGDAIVWASFFFLSYCMILIFSFSPWKRRLGLGGVFSFLIGHSLLLVGREPFVGGSGEAARCYIITRDTISYGSVPGKDQGNRIWAEPIALA